MLSLTCLILHFMFDFLNYEKCKTYFAFFIIFLYIVFIFMKIRNEVMSAFRDGLFVFFVYIYLQSHLFFL